MTKFKGHRTGFNPRGSNDAMPGSAKPTKYTGRGALPDSMKYGADGAANISGSNRRVAKGNMGDGGGSGTRYCGHGAFGNK